MILIIRDGKSQQNVHLSIKLTLCWISVHFQISLLKIKSFCVLPETASSPVPNKLLFVSLIWDNSFYWPSLLLSSPWPCTDFLAV